MNLNNLTIKSQEVIQQAQLIAQENEHQQIENDHIVKGMQSVDKNVLPFLFKKLDINQKLFFDIVDKNLQSYPKVSGSELTLSRDAGKSLNEATLFAKKREDEYVSVEHLFYGMFTTQNKISKILKDQGVTKDHLVKAIDELRQGEKGYF